MGRGLVVVVVAVTLAAACGGGSSGGDEDAGPQTPTATPTAPSEPTTPGPETGETPTPEPTPSATPEGPSPEEIAAARTLRRLSVTGPEEVVFDWTTDRCEDEHIPDIATRAIRGADGRVQLIIGHYVNYRMTGPDLNDLTSDCSGPVLVSDFDPDPSAFDDSEWLAAPYTEDGETVYAVVHHEYRGVTHQAARPGQCPSNDLLTCLDTSMTMFVSTDGGATYTEIAPPPDHLVASLPYVFDDEGVPSGYRQPSNVIRGDDGYHYVFSNVSDYPDVEGVFPPQWMCAMRTDDLSDPSSWRYWDGEAFAGEFRDPYREAVDPDDDTCAPLALAQLSASMTDSVTWNTELGKYVAVGITFDAFSPEPRWGVYYALSDDLVTWTTRRLLTEVTTGATVDPANELFHAYPALLDPDSDSMSFETTDGELYLYISRFNFGGNSLDRDLLRFPVAVETVTLEAPSWDFEADGDLGGWVAENQLEPFEVTGGSLRTTSTGDDPYMSSPPIDVPALAYPTLVVEMTVTADRPTTSAEVFFATEADPLLDEAKLTRFEVRADGAPHTYEIDMSELATWAGLVRRIRIDPVTTEGALIEVHRIHFAE